MGRRRIKKNKPLLKPNINSSRLVEILRPFANVKLPEDEGYKGQPSGDTVYLYVGKSNGYEDGNQGHLTLNDFRRIRQFLKGE